MISKRIVIFGYNRLSYELATRMGRHEHKLIIADSDPSRLALASNNGFTIEEVDYRSDDDLKKIGIGHDVDVLFCFFTEDCENVFLTLSARALAEDLQIISVVEDPQSAEKLLAAGANKIINPFTVCGTKIYEHIKKPAISDLMDHVVFGRHDLNLAEVEIPRGSILENTRSSELRLNERHNLILIGIIDKELGEDLHFALGEQEHHLDAGDILVVLGPSREIRAFKKEIEKIKEVH